MGRRPLHTEDHLIALAHDLKARHGFVTTTALRAAAGGGSPNRIQRILASMAQMAKPPQAPLKPRAEWKEPRTAAMPPRQPGNPPHRPEALSLLGRIERTEHACADVVDRIRQERWHAAAEIDGLIRLIERQNLLIDGLGRILDHTLKIAEQDLRSMRQELRQTLDRLDYEARAVTARRQEKMQAGR